MKKIILLFLIILASSVIINVHAQKNRTLSNGFSIKVTMGFPSSSFGTDSPVQSKWEYGLLGGLQIGNQWYFSPTEKYGFGLMVNWFDFSGVAQSVGDEARATLDISLLEIGPIGTYALSEEMAIDVYYNLRPTVIMNMETWTTTWGGSSSTTSHSWEGAGFTHAIGAGFRWKVLYGGLEYVFGSVREADGSGLATENTEYMKANCFRIIIGVKF